MQRSLEVRRRTGGRSARVVASVLEATLDTLAHAGYGGLTFEEVAERAGVSRTTIYRRWATKRDLVRAALLRFVDDRPGASDTGSVRGDLLDILQKRLLENRTTRMRIRGVLRGLMADAEDPELRALSHIAEERVDAPAIAAIQRGVARGELPAGTDPLLIMLPVFSALGFEALVKGEELDPAFVERLVDVVLAGARTGAAARPR